MSNRRSGASSEAAENTSVHQRPWWRAEARYFVQIAAVAGFAIAQPVLGSFGDSPETFVAAGASPEMIAMFAVAVVLLPALLLWALVATTALAGRRVRELSQAAAIGMVVVLLGLWALRNAFTERWVVIVLASGLGVLAAATYRRFEAVRLYLSFASVAPVAFLVMFLAFSPVSLLVFEPDPATAGSAEATGPRSVVLIVFDELATASLLDAENDLDTALFPNFARFAEDATFYRNNTTVAGHTKAALPAILTGRYSKEAVSARRDYRENLFTLLGDSHQLNVHESLTRLCPASLCERRIESGAISSLGSQAWDLWSNMVEGSDPKAAGTGSANQESADLPEAMAAREGHVVRFLESLQSEGARPRLDFVHLLYPHQQWDRLPDGRHYFMDDYALGRHEGVWSTETAAQLTRQRHLLQLQYVDSVVGQTIDKLKQAGRYDDSYVIVMADHGVSFEEREHGRHVKKSTTHELLWAPLLIKAPGQTEGSRDDRNTETVDVVPTIADAFGMKIPWQVDGHSLLSDDERAPADKRYLSRVGPDEAGSLIEIDGVEGYRRMLAEPPASAVPSDDPLALYRLPPYPALTGTDVDDLPHGSPVHWSVQLTHPERYGSVDPAGDPIPVYISGEVRASPSAPPDGQDPQSSRLVVAVNGVIGGWGAVEQGKPTDTERTRFGVQISPTLLRRGANTIEVFALEGPPDAVTLHPIEGGCCVG